MFPPAPCRSVPTSCAASTRRPLPAWRRALATRRRRWLPSRSDDARGRSIAASGFAANLSDALAGTVVDARPVLPLLLTLPAAARPTALAVRADLARLVLA